MLYLLVILIKELRCFQFWKTTRTSAIIKNKYFIIKKMSGNYFHKMIQKWYKVVGVKRKAPPRRYIIISIYKTCVVPTTFYKKINKNRG